MIFYILLLFCNSASAWIFQNDFDKNDNYIIKKIANNRTIEYCIGEYPTTLQNPHQYVINAFKSWDSRLNKNPKIIENCTNKKALNIKYMYPGKSGSYFTPENRNKPITLLDIIPTFLISNDDFGAFYHNRSSNKVGIIINLTKIEEQKKLSKNELIKRIMIHEIGHSLGLDDEYGYDAVAKDKYDLPLYYNQQGTMKDIFEVSCPTERDLMGLTVLYSRYKKDNIKYYSFIKEEKGYYLNGLKNGKWFFYDTSTGNIFSKCYYSEGLKNGTEETYKTINGRTVAHDKTSYIKGTKNGEYQAFNNNGTLHVKGYFKNGNRFGKWEYADGKCFEYKGTGNEFGTPCNSPK